MLAQNAQKQSAGIK